MNYSLKLKGKEKGQIKRLTFICYSLAVMVAVLIGLVLKLAGA
jgi:hypothetical protein